MSHMFLKSLNTPEKETNVNKGVKLVVKKHKNEDDWTYDRSKQEILILGVTNRRHCHFGKYI